MPVPVGIVNCVSVDVPVLSVFTVITKSSVPAAKTPLKLKIKKLKIKIIKNKKLL